MKTTDWSKLPDDVAIEVFSCLNNRDRASLASTCRSWRHLGSSPLLWQSLDLRFYKFNSKTALSLASRSQNLRKLQFHGNMCVVDAMVSLQASNLREIRCYYGNMNISKALPGIGGPHPALESLELGFHHRFGAFCVAIIKDVALRCPNLRKLKLSGCCGIWGNIIDTLSSQCPNLSEIGILDCFLINIEALGKVKSLRFLTIAGSGFPVRVDWAKLPNLVGLDVSRTQVTSEATSRMLSSSSRLKVVCALGCLNLKEKAHTVGKAKLLADFSDVYHWFANPINDKDGDEIMTWLASVTSHAFLRICENRLVVRSDFWISYIGMLVLRLMLIPKEDVQEIIARALSKLKIDDNVDISAHVPGFKPDVVPQYRDKAIRIILELTKSRHEGLQSEATKAIVNLCRYPSTWNSIVNQGGISIFKNLSRSSITLVAYDAVEGLRLLSAKREDKDLAMSALQNQTNGEKRKSKIARLR